MADVGNNRIQKFDSSGNFLLAWGSLGTLDGQFDGPADVAVDPTINHVYVADHNNHRIQKFDSSGKHLLTWGSSAPNPGSAVGAFDTPRGIGIDAANGWVYVADRFNDRVQKFDVNGTHLLSIGGLGNPSDVAVDASGDIYVTDPQPEIVKKYDSSGTFITQWGSPGSGNGQFQSATGIAAHQGFIYVADSGNNRIQTFDLIGTPIDQWGIPGGLSGTGNREFDDPTGVTVDGSGNVYVADRFNYRIQKLDTGGNYIDQWGSQGGLADGEFDTPDGLATDGLGNVYVADRLNDRIQVFDSSGNHLLSWGSFGSGDSNGIGAGLFNEPAEVAVNPATGDVYVVDRKNERVQKFDSNGTFLTKWGSLGSADGQFDNPTGLAVYGAGIVYVADQINHRIQKFSDGQDVSLPDLTATYNQAITVPVSLSQIDGLVAAEVFIEYDTSLLTVFSEGASSLGTLSDGWSVQSNTEAGAGSLEILKIALATDQNAATGPATLINVNFTVNDVRVPASSPLTLSHVLLNNGWPGYLSNGSVTLVGTDGTIDSSPAQIIPRETIDLTVVDADLNTDSGTQESVVVTALSSTGETETITLDENGVDSDTFTGSINSTFSLTASSGDGIIQAKAGDQIVFTYDDQLDANGNGPVPRTDQTGAIGSTDGTILTTIVSQPGDAVYIRVTDADLNINFSSAETAIVVARNPTGGPSSYSRVTLHEDGLNSDIFFGSIDIVSSSAPSVIAAQKGDVPTFTYDDVVTALGDQVDRVDDNEVVDPFGDADGNGQVQAFDAAKVLLHALSPFLTGLDSLSVNLDLQAFDLVNGKISPFDAALILQKRVGLISIFPVQEDEADNHPQPQTNNAVPKALPDPRLLSLHRGQHFLSVWSDERSGIVSGEVFIQNLDGQVHMAPELADFLSASQAEDDGLHIVFAGAQAVSGPGELLRIYPGVGPDKAQLTRAHFNDGRIVGHIEALATPATLPASVVLHANWPNPFNPETSIRFDLPQAAVVQLEIFDVLGQKVRTLLAGEQSAGSHQVRWNGRDEAGDRVGSGVYFYRLQTEDFIHMRRMLLLK